MGNVPAPHFYRRCWRTRLARRICRKRTSSPTSSPPISGPRKFGNKTSFFYPTHDSLQSFFRSFAERHVADISAAEDRARSVLKDPNFVLDAGRGCGALSRRYSHRLHARSPRHRCILRADRAAADETKPSKYEKRDILFISKKILASYQPLLAAVPPGVVIVRYEGSRQRPESDACKRLGATRDSSCPLIASKTPRWLDAPARHEAAWISELEGAKPSPASIGSFKRMLLGEEIAVVQNICEPIMSHFATRRSTIERCAGIGS